MAKVKIEFDTKSKELAVSMDGKDIPNIQNISLYKAGYYDDKEEGYSFSLVTSDSQDDEGYKSYKQIVARDSAAGREALAKGAGTWADFPDFVYLTANSKLNEEVSRLLKNRRTRN